MEVFLLCQKQVLTTPMGQVIDLDYRALQWVCQIVQVEDQLDCLKRVRVFFEAAQQIKEQNK